MKITILPEKKIIEGLAGNTLFNILTNSGVSIRTACGGQGTCGLCKVKIKSGKYKETAELSKVEKRQDYVLSCQIIPLDDLTVEIPPEVRAVYTPPEISKEIPFEYEYAPLARKLYLQIEKPTLQDNIADFERLKRAIRKITGEIPLFIDLSLLQDLSKFLRHMNWELTVSLVSNDMGHEIINIEPGNNTKNCYGIAIDIGTTTVVAELVDLSITEPAYQRVGKILSTMATYNRQRKFGDDIITRIIHSERGGLKELTTAIQDTINELIDNIISTTKISYNDILSCLVAGNTTMVHLFLGLWPEYIRKEPYIPLCTTPPSIKAKELNIKIHPEGIVTCLPSVSSYVGGDITSGVLASGMYKSPDLSLLVDLGTNGEIVLGNKDWLLCAACSAGPAFEGVGIKSGIFATTGAIQEISISDGKVYYKTIGNTKPVGICGSGLIDTISELLKAGIIDRAGKFVPNSSTLIRESDDGKEFLLVRKENTIIMKDIVITENDIATLIRSKGAVFMGIQVLLREVGLNLDDIKQVFISGAFGTSIDIEKAILIGLLPDLPKERFKFIGNSSITGAVIAILSLEARNIVKLVANKMTYVELSTNPKFMNEYTSTLFLPHTNIDLFPTVKQVIR